MLRCKRRLGNWLALRQTLFFYFPSLLVITICFFTGGCQAASRPPEDMSASGVTLTASRLFEPLRLMCDRRMNVDVEMKAESQDVFLMESRWDPLFFFFSLSCSSSSSCTLLTGSWQPDHDKVVASLWWKWYCSCCFSNVYTQQWWNWSGKKKMFGFFVSALSWVHRKIFLELLTR